MIRHHRIASQLADRAEGDTMIDLPQRTCRQRTPDEDLAVYRAQQRRRPDEELHAMCAHPGWEYATTEGPRKAWYHADTAPDGDGWTRNIHAGRNGWDRLDYTEESYWMRPRMEPGR